MSSSFFFFLLLFSYLCFERSKTQPGKNVVIPLDRIVRLEKGNQYSWIPGGGMIIEVFVQGLDRVYKRFSLSSFATIII